MLYKAKIVLKTYFVKYFTFFTEALSVRSFCKESEIIYKICICTIHYIYLYVCVCVCVCMCVCEDYVNITRVLNVWNKQQDTKLLKGWKYYIKFHNYKFLLFLQSSGENSLMFYNFFSWKYTKCSTYSNNYKVIIYLSLWDRSISQRYQ